MLIKLLEQVNGDELGFAPTSDSSRPLHKRSAWPKNKTYRKEIHMIRELPFSKVKEFSL